MQTSSTYFSICAYNHQRVIILNLVVSNFSALAIRIVDLVRGRLIKR